MAPFLRRRAHLVLAVVALAVALSGCGSGDPSATTANPTIPVVASTNIYAAIVRSVGGNRVTVSSIINDPSADPHTHEPTPAEAASVLRARLVVLNGGGYDDFMSRLVQSRGGATTVVDAVQESGLVPDHGDLNEHVWYSLPTVQKIASRIATDLTAADPGHAAEFAGNASAFNAQVQGLLTKATAIGIAHPGARVAVTEPVPDYLLATAGLTDATPAAFAKAVERDTDPPAAVVAQTLALFGADRVDALVLNAQTQTPTTDQIRQAAIAARVPIVTVTETLPADATDYVTWMGRQIDALAVALDRP